MFRLGKKVAWQLIDTDEAIPPVVQFNGDPPSQHEPAHPEFGQVVRWEDFFEEAKSWNAQGLFRYNVSYPLWRTSPNFGPQAASDMDLVFQICVILSIMREMTGLHFSIPDSTSSSRNEEDEEEEGAGDDAQSENKSTSNNSARYNIYCRGAVGPLSINVTIIEVIKPGFIPLGASLIELAQAYNPEEQHQKSENDSRSSARSILQQLNHSLSITFPQRVGYGIISTLFQFWFVKRVPGNEPSMDVLYVSEPLDYRGNNPTLLRALGFLFYQSLDELNQQQQQQMRPVGLAQIESKESGEDEADAGPPNAKRAKKSEKSSGQQKSTASNLGKKLMSYQSLGHGRCGHVLLAESPNGPVAVKAVPSSNSKLVPELQREAQVYESLNGVQGDAIPRLFHAGPLLGGSYYGLCLELVGMNLARALKLGVNKERLKQGALEALQKLHAAKFLHGDIRPENICYQATTQRVYLIDLAFARRLEHEEEAHQETNAMRYLFDHCD